MCRKALEMKRCLSEGKRVEARERTALLTPGRAGSGDNYPGIVIPAFLLVCEVAVIRLLDKFAGIQVNKFSAPVLCPFDHVFCATRPVPGRPVPERNEGEIVF
jgi:hypothetical protein